MGAQSSPVPVSKQQVTSPVASENSPHANASSDASGQSSSAKAKQTVAANPFGSGSDRSISNNNNSIPMQQFSVHGRENQMPPRLSVPIGNGMSSTHPAHSSANTSQGVDHSFHVKSSQNNPETLQMQYHRYLNGYSLQAVVPNGGSGK